MRFLRAVLHALDQRQHDILPRVSVPPRAPPRLRARRLRSNKTRSSWSISGLRRPAVGYLLHAFDRRRELRAVGQRLECGHGQYRRCPDVAIDRSDRIYVAYVKVDASRTCKTSSSRDRATERHLLGPVRRATGSAALGVFANVPNLGVDSAGNIGLTFGGFTAG